MPGCKNKKNEPKPLADDNTPPAGTHRIEQFLPQASKNHQNPKLAINDETLSNEQLQILSFWQACNTTQSKKPYFARANVKRELRGLLEFSLDMLQPIGDGTFQPTIPCRPSTANNMKSLTQDEKIPTSTQTTETLSSSESLSDFHFMSTSSREDVNDSLSDFEMIVDDGKSPPSI